MMSGFSVSPSAVRDLDQIWDYYSVELQNPEVADRIHEELFEAFGKLANMPEIGHYRRDLSDTPVRFWLVRHYLILYRSENRPVEILRVLHGARNIGSMLGRNLLEG